jgi:uncharacterized protein (DUF2147 family)
MYVKTIFLTLGMFSLAMSATADPLEVNGLWMTQSKTGLVEIKDCGDGTPCGELVWIDAPVPTAQLDDNNPDESLRSRSIVGIQMIWGFQNKGSGWKKGRIYSPEEGKTYRSTIKKLDDGNLQVKGCVGPFCQAQVWTPVAASTMTASELD